MDRARSPRSKCTGTDPDTGYRASRLGSFEFRRDEYFAHIEWPKGSHIIEIDRFLRAMVRDIGWGFFYGWIFFDDIFGTTNHYGTVDIFAGAYDHGLQGGGHRLARDLHAPRRCPRRSRRSASDWISEGYDPLSAPLETGTPMGSKGEERKDPLLRGFIAAKPHARPARRPAGALATRPAPDQPRLRRRGLRQARDRVRAGLRGPAPRDQPVRPHRPLRRHLEPVDHARSPAATSAASPARSTCCR